MDAELEAQQAHRAQRADADVAPQRVLVGHSMGGAAVAEGVIANPEVWWDCMRVFA